MANRWGNNGNSERLFWGGSKIIADGDCSHEIKGCLVLGRKAMTRLDSIIKSRDITLPAKVHLVKAMVFPIVMYGYECWTIKKAECQIIGAFELWCWRILRVPWTARRSNLKENSPEYSLEGLILNLKLQNFGHLMWRTDSFGKDPDAGKDWRQEEKGMTEDEMAGWHHRLNGHEFEWAPGVGDGQGGLVCCSAWGHKESTIHKELLRRVENSQKELLSSTEQLNWTELNKNLPTNAGDVREEGWSLRCEGPLEK